MGTIFLLSSVLAVVGAVLTVSRKNPVYSLLFLLASFGGSAGVYYSLSATFVAVSQIIVYAGAIAVLFLFVLMFIDLGRKGEESLPERVGSLAVYEPAAANITVPVERDRYMFSLPAALVSMALFAMFVLVIGGLPENFDAFQLIKQHETVIGVTPVGKNAVIKTEYFGSLLEFGKVMMEDYPLHFEVVGLVILIGVMGAVMIGRNIRDAEESASGLAQPKNVHDHHPGHGHDAHSHRGHEHHTHEHHTHE